MLTIESAGIELVYNNAETTIVKGKGDFSIVGEGRAGLGACFAGRLRHQGCLTDWPPLSP